MSHFCWIVTLSVLASESSSLGGGARALELARDKTLGGG